MMDFLEWNQLKKGTLLSFTKGAREWLCITLSDPEFPTNPHRASRYRVWNITENNLRYIYWQSWDADHWTVKSCQ